MGELPKSIHIGIDLLRLALHHRPVAPHLICQSFLDFVLHHFPRIACGIDEVVDLVEEVIDVTVAVAQAVPFLY